MRMFGLALVTSLAVGYLAHTPARASECDATAVQSRAPATADLPIYYGGTLAPIVIVGERQVTNSAPVAAQPAAARSAVLN